MRPYLWTPARSRPSGSARLTLQHENAFWPFYKDHPLPLPDGVSQTLRHTAPNATPEPLTASGVKTGCKASQGQDRLVTVPGFPLCRALHDVFRMSVIPCIDNQKPAIVRQIPVPDSSPPDPDMPVAGTCPNCGNVGTVTVSPFRWSGADHLHWHCSSCRHVWITHERRKEQRVDAETSR
jgi:hypothetical protein